jgi:hypothetical protein
MDHALGERIAAFGPKRGFVWLLCAMAIFCAFMSALFVAVAVLAPAGPAGNPRLLFGVFLAAGALCVAGFLYMFAEAIRLKSTEVVLHSGGLAIGRGGRLSIIPWDAIEIVLHNKKVVYAGVEDRVSTMLAGEDNVYTLETRGGERFVLNTHLHGLEFVGLAILRETVPRLLKAAKKTYQVEGSVEFNKLAVSRDGLSKGGKTVLWIEVGSVAQKNGYIWVRRPDGRRAWWLGVPMHRGSQRPRLSGARA